MAKEPKPLKVKAKKDFTRAQAERALSAGANPEDFLNHKNYHVRRKCWQLQGRPLPDDFNKQNEFLATLQGQETPKDKEAHPGFYALIRQRILKEVPRKEVEVSSDEVISENMV